MGANKLKPNPPGKHFLEELNFANMNEDLKNRARHGPSPKRLGKVISMPQRALGRRRYSKAA